MDPRKPHSPAREFFRGQWAAAGCSSLMPPVHMSATLDAIDAVLDNRVEGALVDCGGEACLAMAEAALQRGDLRRIIVFLGEGTDQGAGAIRSALAKAGYPAELLRIEPGALAETVAVTSTLRVALLSIVGDDPDDLAAALRSLYPRMSHNSPVIASVSETQNDLEALARISSQISAASPARPMVWKLAPGTVAFAKADTGVHADIERYDYVPPGMSPPDLLGLFPSAEARNPWQVQWRYLRCEAPHRWRTDPRDQSGIATGYASVEEAACLYALARQHAGKRGLEIGTHFGWTAAHLVAAGLKLDCIDPAFHEPTRYRQVTEALSQVSGTGGFRLWPGFSPDMLDEARSAATAPWSFAFIDGSHDGEGPRNDALAVIPHLDRDATVVFHDLTSPFVERGLYAMRRAGFKIRLFNTMQILGVAWRGNVRLPEHVADPNVPRIYHSHLAKYQNDSLP